MQLFWKIWTIVIQWQKLLLKWHVLHCSHFNLACLQQLPKQRENPQLLLFSQADVSVWYIKWKNTIFWKLGWQFATYVDCPSSKERSGSGNQQYKVVQSMKFHLYQAKADLYWNWKKNYYYGYKSVIWYLDPSYHMQAIIYTLYLCIDMYNVCAGKL